MDIEKAIMLIGAIFGSGGIIAFLKSRSEIRNANKNADITALSDTLSTLQRSYKELQDRYQEAIKDCYSRNKELEKRIEFLEIEYVKQEQQKSTLQDRVKHLEESLRIANLKIEQLETQLHKRDLDIMRLEQENIDLRKKSGERVGLQE